MLRWHDYDEAQRLAVEVERLGVHYAALENKPQQLMERIAAARRAGGRSCGWSSTEFGRNGTGCG